MRNSKRISVLAGGTAALIGVGVAFAAWTSVGTGTGTAVAISDVGLVVAGDDVTGLYPTGTKTITVTVTNDNPYKVALDSITVDSIASNDANCDVPSSVSANSNMTPGATLAGNGGSDTFPFVVSMDDDADNDCQGDTFTVTFTANGHSSN